MQIEEDVDYDEVRSHEERGLDWKYLAISDQETIFVDDPIERYLDEVRQEDLLLPSPLMKILDMV